MKKDLPAAQFPLVLPLVLSILAEIKDRRRRFRLLQAAARAEPRTKLGMRRQELARAESQAHQTELRRAMHELEQLGCFPLRLDPPLLAIRTREGPELQCVIWQP